MGDLSVTKLPKKQTVLHASSKIYLWWFPIRDAFRFSAQNRYRFAKFWGIKYFLLGSWYFFVLQTVPELGETFWQKSFVTIVDELHQHNIQTNGSSGREGWDEMGTSSRSGMSTTIYEGVIIDSVWRTDTPHIQWRRWRLNLERRRFMHSQCVDYDWYFNCVFMFLFEGRGKWGVGDLTVWLSILRCSVLFWGNGKW